MIYMVKAKNKMGYVQESEQNRDYSKAFDYAMECLDSGQYSTIIIVADWEDGVNDGKFFLHRIIK